MRLDVEEEKRGTEAAVERLLQQVEQSASHYEALGVTRSASTEQIKAAFEQAVNLLQHATPSAQHNHASVATDDGFDRIELAHKRLAQAFSVLTNPNKKIEYDRFVIGKSAPVKPSGELHPTEPTAFAIRDVNDQMPNTESKGDEDENRRRCQRFNLSLPVRVIGYDRKTGKWAETSSTVNVSRTGISVRLKRRVRLGMVLCLSLPLPAKMRSHGVAEPNYTVYAIVRRVQPANNGVRFVGLEFLGEQPPKDYAAKPWAAFRTRNWQGVNRRRIPRRECNEIVTLEYFNEFREHVKTEIVRSENIGDGGLRVVTPTVPAEFEFLRVGYPSRNLENYAVVCNRYVGTDGFERLCLKFIDGGDVAEQMRAQQRSSVQTEIAARQRAPIPMPAPACAPETITPPTRSKKILVADDDLPLRRVLGKILTSAGYEVILVEDGLAAVEKVREEKPDLVITDALMPRLHGFLACKEIKQIESPPKVIMLTAVYTKLSYRMEAKQRYGADDLLTKPFVVADLLACVEKHLAAAPRARL